MFSLVYAKSAYIFLMVYSFHLWPLTHIQRTKMLLINLRSSGSLQTLVTILSFVLLLPWTELKHQYFGHLMWRVDSLEETLMLGGIGGRRRRGRQRMNGWMASLTRWSWVWVNSESWWWTGRPGVLRFMDLQRVGYNWATEVNWTELSDFQFHFLFTKDHDS